MRPRSLRAAVLVLAVAASLRPAGAQEQPPPPARLRELAAEAEAAQREQTRPGAQRALGMWQEIARGWVARRQADSAARALVRVAALHTRLGQRDSALHAARAALAEASSPGGGPRGAALAAVGVAHFALNRPDSARHYLEAAVAAHRDAKDGRGEALALTRLGSLVGRLGRTDSAMVLLNRALTLHRQLGDSVGEAEGLAAIGARYLEIERLDSAAHFQRAAAARFRTLGERLGEATAIHNGAIVLARLSASPARRDLGDSALVLYQRALWLRRAMGDSAAVASTLLAIGTQQVRLGRTDSAAWYWRDALRAGGRLVDPRVEALTLNNLGNLLADRHDADSALHYFHRALAALRTNDDRREEARVLENIAHVYAGRYGPRARDGARAVAYYDSALALGAAVREAAGSDANALAFASALQVGYASWALTWLSRAPEIGDSASATAAWAAVERGRAQGLHGLLRRAGRGAAVPAPRAAADLVAEGAAMLAPHRRARRPVLAYLASEDTLVGWLLTPRGSVRTIRARVPDTTLVALVRAVRIAMERTPGDAGTLALARTRAVVQARDVVRPRVEEAAAPDASLARLADLLLPPSVTRDLPPGHELVIVPAGILTQVPFGALRVPGTSEALGARYALRIAPSLAVLAQLESRVGPGARLGTRAAEALVVGDPVMPAADASAPPLERLPNAALEAQAVARRLRVRPVLGEQATESAVRARLARAPLVHLATHGIAFDSDALARASFVALAPDAAHDGRLTMGELIDDPALGLDAELVVLSACQTGLGRVYGAEGTVGLQRALLARGARSVLTTLWNVDDGAMRYLVERFYAHWLGGTVRPSKAEALRRAVRDVRRSPQLADPRYWAGVQLVGTG